MYENSRYDLFIIHSWKYQNDYNELIRLLNSRENFRYVNYSMTPQHNIIPHNVMVDDTILSAKLASQIEKSQIVIVIAGMYTIYSRWMTYELATAKSLNKPILAIKPLNNQRIPELVLHEANKVISWNMDSLFRSMDELIHPRITCTTCFEAISNSR